MRAAELLRVVAVPDFRKLWLIGLILSCGRWLEMLAVSVYVYQRTGSALLVSVVAVARFAPMGLFGAVIGAIAERVDRRGLLVLINSALFASAVALAVLERSGMLQVWHLVLASFLSGISFTADFPVRRLMLGEVVGGDRVVTALAIDSTSGHGTRTVGPFIGGALLAAAGIGSVFLFQSVLYAGATVAAMRVRRRVRTSIATHGSLIGGLREGWAICREEPRLIGILWLTVVFNVFCFPYLSMVAVIGADILHLDAARIGILGSMDGLGALLGALSVSVLIKRPQYERLFVGGVLVALGALLPFALVGNAWLAGAALVVLGFAMAGFAVMQSTLIFLYSPAHARARTMGLLSMAIGFSPLGILLMGVLADTFGPVLATTAMALAGFAVIVLTPRYWWALVRRPAR